MLNRLVTPVGTAILLVDRNADHARAMKTALSDQGFGLAGVISDPTGIPDGVAATEARVVIVNADKVDGPLVSALEKIPATARRPTVLFCADASTEAINAAIDAGVNAYVLEGSGADRLRAAIDLAEANYRTISRLTGERDEARDALKARKVIERAKGLIMKEKGLDEEQAYRLLRSHAMQKGQRLVDIATTITEAAEVMK